MATPTLAATWASSSANESTSTALSVQAGDLVVIQWAAATPAVTFTLTGGSGATFYRTNSASTITSLTSSGVGQTSATNPNGDIDVYQSDTASRVAFVTSVMCKTGGTIAVSHAVASGSRRFVVYVVRPPAGYYWTDAVWQLGGGGRVVRAGYGTAGVLETTTAYFTTPFDYRTQNGGLACAAQLRGTAATATADFGSGTVTHDATADTSVVGHTFKQLFDYNDGTWSAASVSYSSSMTNKSATVAMYGLTRRPVAVTATTTGQTARASATIVKSVVQDVGSAAAIGAAAVGSFAVQGQIPASQAVGVATAQGAVARIVDVGTAANTPAARARGQIAPYLPTKPLTLVARETGVVNDYDVTSPYAARVNDTAAVDAFGADLGFSWDGGGGKAFVAFGDTFGSSWVGPFTTRQTVTSTSVAAGSAGASVGALTELYVARASAMLAVVSPATFRRVTVTTSTGYATFRYTGRDTVNNKLTGLTLEAGTGTVALGAAVTTGDPRGSSGNWRSQTLAYHTDTNLADGYTLDGWITDGTGAAAQLISSTHSGDTTSARYTAGTPLTVTSIYRVFSGLIAVTTATNHNITRSGQLVYFAGLSGALGAELNGQDWRVCERFSSTVFYILKSGADVSAYNPGGTVTLQPNLNPTNPTLNPEVTLVPTGGVSIPRAGSARGYRQVMCLMSVNHWGDNGGNSINYAGLAYSDDDGQTWTRTTWRWDNDATFASRITGLWMWRHTDGYVYALSQGIYRVDAPVALRCLQDDVLTQSSWEYWDGTSWIANTPTAAVPVWSVKNAAGAYDGSMGEPSLYYNPGNQCWVSVYLNEIDFVNGYGIYMRSASRVEGPWSTPQKLHDAAYWSPPQGVYGGFIHPWSAVPPQGASDLYFHVSLADPYSTYLMKTTLGPQFVDGQAVGAGVAGVSAVTIISGTAVAARAMEIPLAVGVSVARVVPVTGAAINGGYGSATATVAGNTITIAAAAAVEPQRGTAIIGRMVPTTATAAGNAVVAGIGSRVVSLTSSATAWDAVFATGVLSAAYEPTVITDFTGTVLLGSGVTATLIVNDGAVFTISDGE